MEVGDTIKIKKPSFPYQQTLRYIVTKATKKKVDCYEVESPKHIYKDIPKSTVCLAETANKL